MSFDYERVRRLSSLLVKEEEAENEVSDMWRSMLVEYVNWRQSDELMRDIFSIVVQAYKHDELTELIDLVKSNKENERVNEGQAKKERRNVPSGVLFLTFNLKSVVTIQSDPVFSFQWCFASY